MIYARLCGEAWAERLSPRKTVVGCPFKFVANAIRHTMIETHQAAWLKEYKERYHRRFGIVWGEVCKSPDELAQVERDVIALHYPKSPEIVINSL